MRRKRGGWICCEPGAREAGALLLRRWRSLSIDYITHLAVLPARARMVHQPERVEMQQRCSKTQNGLTRAQEGRGPPTVTLENQRGGPVPAR